MLTFSVDFDYTQYGFWMDQQHMRTEFINFMLLNPEIFNQSTIINARTYTMFATACEGIKDLSDLNSMNFVSSIARSCFGKDTTVGDLFAAFVNNRLDKLMSAKEILSGKWEDTKERIKDNVIKDGMYRADIASVLTLRLINYIELLDKVDAKTVDSIVNRVNDIVCCSETLLSEDLIFNLISNMNKNPKFTKKCIKLLMNPKVQAKILN